MKKLLIVSAFVFSMHALAWEDPYEKTTAPGYEEYIKGVNCLLVNNSKEAIQWFAQASMKGNLLAGYNGAIICLKGDGIPADTALAVKCLRALVDAGYAPAQLILGRMHLEGKGVKKMPNIGFHYVKLSADQGYTDAKALLAELYLKGNGTPVNEEEGLNIAEKEALAGNGDCQFLLGKYYFDILPPDYEKSVNWFNMGIKNSSISCIGGLIDVYMKLEKYDKVHQAINKGREISKAKFENPDIIDAILLDYEGECFLKEGKEAEARAIWNKLKANYPSYVEENKFEVETFCCIMYEAENNTVSVPNSKTKTVMISDVDIKIPDNSLTGEPVFAVIIANERYQDVAPVEYAIHDGEMFAKYCEKTLGVPKNNIKMIPNATLNNIKQQVTWLGQVMDVYQGEAKIIFYYAGHGIPDEKNKSAYLLPVDGIGTDVSTGYSLNELFKSLGSKPSKNITIFMDACFSGAQRGEGMLASARGVALKAKAEAPQGNMVVFSAASGDETAYPYKEKGHGLFTYFLLKKLQESKGDCTFGELGEYIQTNVRQQSVVVNRKSQTPTVVPSTSFANDWKNLKLR